MLKSLRLHKTIGLVITEHFNLVKLPLQIEYGWVTTSNTKEYGWVTTSNTKEHMGPFTPAANSISVLEKVVRENHLPRF